MTSSMSAVCAVAQVSLAKFARLPSNVIPCFPLRFIWLEGKDHDPFHICEC